MDRYVDLVFDCPPGPKRPGLIEVQTETGASIELGEWIARPDGTWTLRIRALPGQDQPLPID